MQSLSLAKHRPHARILVLLLLTVLALALAGCAPRPGAGETLAAAAENDVVVDLPSIALDVSEDGSVSLGGVNISELAGGFGVPLELPITSDQVKMLTGLGIQHIQVANQPSGLALLINGQAVPSLAWTKDELTNVADLVPTMPQLAELLPILTQLGVGVTLNLPVAEGATRAPLMASAEGSAAADLAANQAAFVESVGELPRITLPVVYDAEGNFTIAGLTGEAWTNITGQSFFESLKQTPAQIAWAQNNGLQTLDVQIDPNGLRITANEEPLPYIDLSGGKLASIIDLAKSTGALNIPGLDEATLDTLLNQFLPILTSATVDLSFRFPTE